MGLENREGGKWISVYDGKFTQRVNESVAGAVQRVMKNGKAVFEKHYDSFTGKLLNIRTQESPFGKQWVLDFKDREDVYHLTLGYSSGFASTFLKILPNIDTSKEMKLSSSSKEENGKKKHSLFINQDGVALKHFYTKENPNGIPQWEQLTVKGVQVWDNTKELEFLENMVKTTILPKLEGGVADAKAESEYEALGGEEEVKAEDVPF
jgi:hypothetical protein